MEKSSVKLKGVSDKIKILLIDDDEDDMVITLDLLNDVKDTDYKLDWVSTFNDGLFEIKKERHDVYIIDYRLDREDGLKLLQEAIEIGCDAPMILLTGLGDHEIDRKAMELGAYDYLVKDEINSLSLERSIRYAININRSKKALQSSEIRLRQAQKLEAIGRLAGGVAHDFNNILTAIIGYSEYIIDNLHNTDPLRNDAKQIKIAAYRAAKITKQLLAFSKRQVLELEFININDVINEMKNLLMRSIGKKIEFEIKISDEINEIDVNKEQVEQIILNLVLNARDAIPEAGEIKIETFPRQINENVVIDNSEIISGNYTVLRVSDTGTGMDDNIKSKIFDPFFTTKEIGKGIGLGLSTVYGVVRQFGGHIIVRSEVNVGTTFEIFFPVNEISIEQRKEVFDISRVGRETILVINDQNSISNLIIKILKSRNYNVLEVLDATRALKMTETYDGKIHLVISNLILPNISGLELGKDILQIKPDINILFITDHVEENIEMYLDEKMSYLVKPFSILDLATKIESCLNKNHTG